MTDNLIILLCLLRFTITQIQYSVSLGVSRSNAIVIMDELMGKQHQKTKKLEDEEDQRVERERKKKM